ncbi:MAG: PLP-dependent transferase [Cocleimonas sp.]|nr:PLP-dependent transferase [Cocleimonas sp.]
MKKQHPETAALHFRIDNSETHPVATPIYQNSAFTADSPYFYTRKSNPNSVELEGALALLEKSKHVISTTTGMSAIMLVLQQLKPNDHLVINQYIYGCSYKLFQRYAKQMGLTLTILDLSTETGREAIPDDVAMVLFETPTNPFLKTIPIQAVAKITAQKNPNAWVVVDNTWATALFQNPLECGADISLASATKYVSGHSDVMGGFIAVNEDQLADDLLQTRFYSGAILDPNSAWLLRRSLHTFPLRMREHLRITQRLSAYLNTREEVEKIYLAETNPEQLRDYGGIIFFEFSLAYQDYYVPFRDALTLFDTGTGMACVSSMVAQPWSGSHASLCDHEKTAMGINRGLVRLCFGLENEADLIADLEHAFATLMAIARHETIAND